MQWYNRGPGDKHKLAIEYKSEKRQELVDAGYRIRGNSGDQWSDLLGYAIAQRSFKLPNPMYYIAWFIDFSHIAAACIYNWKNWMIWDLLFIVTNFQLWSWLIIYTFLSWIPFSDASSIYGFEIHFYHCIVVHGFVIAIFTCVLFTPRELVWFTQIVERDYLFKRRIHLGRLNVLLKIKRN